MSQPAMHQPMDPVGFCAPHLVLGVNVHATTTVGGTAMCTDHAVANMTAVSSSTSTGGTSTGGTGLVIRLG